MSLIFSRKTLTVVLTLGSTYAWYANITKIVAFYDVYGTFARFQNTTLPNPLITPCFYGGIAFLIALWLSLRNSKYLHLLLMASTLFAWGNWSWGIVQYSILKSSDTIFCSGTSASNPFLTPCFIGASFFTSALIISHKGKRLAKATSSNHT